MTVKKTNFGAAIPYIAVQFLGGAVAALMIEKQLTKEMHDKLLDIGPLGVPTPEPGEKFKTTMVEFIAIMIIHMVRVSVIVDTNGHNVNIFSNIV